MKVGDLVRYHWPSFLGCLGNTVDDKGIGIILEEPKVWVDSGAPDRNFGTLVVVKWPDGSIVTCEEDELVIVNENR